MGCGVRNFFWIVQIGDSDNVTVFWGLKRKDHHPLRKKSLDGIPGLVLMAREGCRLL
jgi:hypothetical protein